MTSKAKNAWEITGNILLWIFVILCAIFTVMVLTSTGQDKDGIPALFGKAPIGIVSDSMKGTFSKGDLIICDKITQHSERAGLSVGDVITYRTDIDLNGVIEPGELNTHRIVDKYEENGFIYFVTRGDNSELCPVNDEPVIESYVVGKYTDVRIPWLGAVFNFLRSSTGFLICIVIPLIIFFLYELYRFIDILIGSKRRKLSKEEEADIKRKAVEEYLEQQKVQQPADEPHEEGDGIVGAGPER